MLTVPPNLLNSYGLTQKNFDAALQEILSKSHDFWKIFSYQDLSNLTRVSKSWWECVFSNHQIWLSATVVTERFNNLVLGVHLPIPTAETLAKHHLIGQLYLVADKPKYISNSQDIVSAAKQIYLAKIFLLSL